MKNNGKTKDFTLPIFAQFPTPDRGEFIILMGNGTRNDGVYYYPSPELGWILIGPIHPELMKFADFSDVTTTPLANGYLRWDANAQKVIYVTSIAAANVSGLSAVATSGEYADLLNKPSAYTLPIGTASALGGVKEGSGVTINPSTGLLTVQTISGNSGTATKLATPRTIGLTGDVTGSGSFDGSANLSFAATLADSGVTAGTYNGNITVNGKGVVTGASAMTGANVTTALGYTPYNATNPNNYINAAGAPVQSINTRTGAITLSKSDVGLANVDNTTDLLKPLSTAAINALALKMDYSALGAPNGAASLGSDGKLLSSQIPTTLLGATVYQGVWNASTNTPTLANGVGTKGFYYKVSVAGNTTIDGNTGWTIGDMIIFNGTTWDQMQGGTSDVSTVFGRVGTVTLLSSDVTGALGFTPYNAANPSNYITAAQAPVQQVNGKTGTFSLTKTDIGLNLVDNTADASKPVSSLQTTAIATAKSEAIAASAPLAHVGSGGTAHANAVANGAAGFISGANQAKLDGIAASANNYSLPVATASVLGGVKQGTGTTIAGDGTISVALPTNNSFSFVGLSDTNNTPVALGVPQWNAGATSMDYFVPAAVATTGQYADLQNKPDLTQFDKITAAFSMSANVAFTTLNTWVDLPLDVEYIKDTGFTHVTTPSTTSPRVTFTKAGRYEITIQASAFRSTGSNVSYGVRIVSSSTPTGTYTQLQSASSYSIANAANILQSNVTAKATVDVAVNQTIKVQLTLTTVGGVTITPASTLLTIQEV